MVNVYFTVDAEIWCGWKDLDDRFPAAFRRYVYGPAESGQYGLPMTSKVLADHGLKAVFLPRERKLSAQLKLHRWSMLTDALDDARLETIRAQSWYAGSGSHIFAWIHQYEITCLLAARTLRSHACPHCG